IISTFYVGSCVNYSHPVLETYGNSSSNHVLQRGQPLRVGTTLAFISPCLIRPITELHHGLDERTARGDDSNAPRRRQADRGREPRAVYPQFSIVGREDRGDAPGRRFDDRTRSGDAGL